MSLADLAAALIGLREQSYKDHQRLTAEVAELHQTVDASRTAVDEVLDHRLGQAAQVFRDLERRLSEQYQRRLDGLQAVLLQVGDRLEQLAAGAADGTEPAELQARLESLAAPAAEIRRALAEAGLVRLDTVGQPYDPLYHEVVQREYPADCTAEYVLAELQSGWWQAGADHAVARAKVVVAAPPVRRDEADA